MSDLPGGQPYYQEEVVIYWESLQTEGDSASQPILKRECKRPNIASYITEVIRDSLKEMSPEHQQRVTPCMTSHSIRRGAAAHANASPKLAIQWISTRRAWLLESFTKVFSYICTTTREDQSVGKVLTGNRAPDLPVMTPTIDNLQLRLSIVEYGRLVTLRYQLFHHNIGSPESRFNVAIDVVNAAFAALLIHMDTVLESVRTSSTSAYVHRYLYELERGIAATLSEVFHINVLRVGWPPGEKLADS